MQAPYGEDFGVKNGDLRLAPIFRAFFLIYQYHILDRPQIIGRGITAPLNRPLCRSDEKFLEIDETM